jgi:YVTN family beta-propeller protein
MRTLQSSLIILSLALTASAQGNPDKNAQNNNRGAQGGASSAQRDTGNAQALPDQPFYRAEKKKSAGDKDKPARPLSSLAQSFEKQGVRIDFKIISTPDAEGRDSGLVAGGDAVATFRVTDARTGQPIRGLRPNAWINAGTGEQAPNEAECKDTIRGFAGGLLSVRPTIDLNNYMMLTLNHDNTITFINPLISFSITKLESVVVLPGTGADWVLSKGKDFLYVTMPDQSAVAVVNTVTRKLVDTIKLGEKTRPVRVAVQPDGRFVWVGIDNSSQVAVIDPATNKLAATINAGQGLHNIAFTADSRFAYVTNSAADTVSVVDAKTLAKVADIAVGKTPVPIAYSAASRLIYVAAINGASVSVIDPSKQQVVKSIPVRRGVVALRFEPEGRYAFAVNQVESKISVIDAATGTTVGETKVVGSPDQVAFTNAYAYVRGTASEKFSLIELAEVKKGNLSPVDIQAGQLPASSSPDDINVSDMIQPTPEGNSVMIANAADKMIYYYVEGMMAPMGTFDNYRRRARALLLVDRSLAEVEPGVYSTPVRLTKAGRFDVPVLIDQPRLVNCFQLFVADSPNGEKEKPKVSIAVEALFKDQKFKSGQPATLRFKITDPVTKQPLTGLEDVHVLVFQPPGIWQMRQWAKEIGGGIYEVTQVFPGVGAYRVMTEVKSRDVRFADLHFTPVAVSDDPAAPTAKDPGVKGGTQK